MCFEYFDQDITDSCKLMYNFIELNKNPKVILDKLLDEFECWYFLYHFGWTNHFEYKESFTVDIMNKAAATWASNTQFNW